LAKRTTTTEVIPEVIGVAPRRYFTADEAAAYLRVSEWFIEESVREGLLTSRVAGRTDIFTIDDLDQLYLKLPVADIKARKAAYAKRVKAA
jgi:hypothetical protein